MLIRAALVLLLMGSAVDDLKPARIQTLQVSVPAIWKHLSQKGTQLYYSPARDAKIAIDVGKTAHAMSDSVCRDKIVKAEEANGETGWEQLSIGAHAAARHLDVDVDPKGKKFDTVMYVGCDGHTTWSMMFSVLSERQGRYMPVFDRVAHSVRYATGGR